ncbi:hypothetical protein WI36_09820 [Burkholderia ubonensis]|nr:hypothetical protein WI36_09820 [Burkholderia ubonensis]
MDCVRRFGGQPAGAFIKEPEKAERSRGAYRCAAELTPAGRALLDHAAKVIDQVNRMAHEMSDYR